jgi:amino acid adenylation domain-containing protein
VQQGSAGVTSREAIATAIPRWRAEGTSGTGELVVSVPDVDRLRLALLADAEGCSIGDLLLAAYLRVVAALARETEVLVGWIPGAGSRALPLRVAVKDAWRDLVATARAATAELRAHADEPPPGDEPAVDTAFCAGSCGHGTGPAVALTVAYDDAPDGLRLRIAYGTGLFDADHVERIGGYLLRAIAALGAAPDADCRDAELLSDAERLHQLYQRGGPARPQPPKRFHELFAEQARRRPDATAAVAGDESWSYGTLDRAANRVAHALLAKGIGREDVVAVVSERNLHWLAAIIGLLRAGGVYLPIEPTFPAARIATLLRRSGCRFILADRDGAAVFSDAAVTDAPPVLAVADALASDLPDTDPAVPVQPDQLAYVYFTSGSTGEPKGAMCEHAGMLNHLLAKIDDLELGPDDVVIQNAQQCFDISLWQLLAPLLSGGQVAIVERADILDPRRFLRAVTAHRATVVQVVPSYLEILVDFLEQHPCDLTPVRYVCVTGEAVTHALVSRWFALNPGRALVNAYGATEASDDTTHEVMRAAPAGGSVPVGRPVRNVTVYVLDEAGGLLPLGSVGEVAFSGICVGRGYINDPDRTDEVFAEDHFHPGTRLYRTGDYGRWLPSGSLEFHGRRDEQVKIRGVRLELGEVEAQLLDHPDVRSAAVVVTGRPGEEKCLVGFYTGAEACTPQRLLDFLRAVLPASALPTRLYPIEALPLTENGKVDKRRLAADAAMLAGEPDESPAAPDIVLTPTEQRLAAAWSAVLRRPVAAIGRDDHFFDSGGTSLAALRLITLLEGLVTLDDLLRAPVLSRLAAVVDGARVPDGGMLRRLSGDPARAELALVCLPHAAGTAMDFRPLAAAVAGRDDAIVVYAAQLPGHDPQEPAPLRDVAELGSAIATEVTAAVRVPSVLWGHGCGVALATETGHRLAAAGTPPLEVFVSGWSAAPAEELERRAAAVEDLTDDELLGRLADESSLGDLCPPDPVFVAEVYRHDVRSADRYLASSLRSPAPPLASATVLIAAASHDTAQATGWDALARTVRLRTVDSADSFFARTRPHDAAALVLELRERQHDEASQVVGVETR